MFTLAEREIYRFSDGTKTIAKDPLKVQRRLLAYPDLQIQEDLKLMGMLDKEHKDKNGNVKQPPKQVLEAFDRILAAARYAFELQELSVDDSGNVKGFADDEVLLLMFDYLEFMNELRGKAKPLPTSLESMAPKS